MKTSTRLRFLLLALVAASLAFAPGCGKGGDDHDHAHKDHDHDHDGGHKDEEHHHAPPRGGIMIELGQHEFQVEFKIQKDLGVFTMWIMDGHAESPVKIAAAEIELDILSPLTNPTEIEKKVLDPIGDDAWKTDFTISLKPVANENTGEKVGDTSQFDAPLEALQGRTKFEASITRLVIRGKVFPLVRVSYDDAKVKK